MNEVETKFWARFTGVHPEDTCKGRVCVVHNPLDHHMREWPMVWRGDRVPPIVERICECGVAHPDPSQGEYWGELNVGGWIWTHGCCGHCIPPERGNND